MILRASNDVRRAGLANRCAGLDIFAAENFIRVETNAVADAASRVHDKAADLKKSTARYIRKNDVSEMVSDAVGLVKAHPGKSLVVALVIGFVAGQMFKKE